MAMTGPNRPLVRLYSATSATRNMPLDAMMATQNGLSPRARAAAMIMGTSGKNATLVNTWPTWPTSKA